MSNTKHTPGPWTITHRKDGLYDIYDGPHDVALCAHPNNAALIAEAPTMFDLLLRANDVIEALDGTSVENEKLVDDYRALLNRIIFSRGLHSL